MKKIFTVIALSAVMSTIGIQTLSAQESRLDARVGVGFYSFDDFVSIFGMIGNAFNKCDHRKGNSYLLNPNISVTYKMYDWLSIGAGATVGNMNSRDYDASGVMIHSVDFTYTTATVFADTYYFRRGNWAMYGSYGLGATLFSDTSKNLDDESGKLNKTTKNSVHFNFQFYPISFRYGSRWGGFAELGWGCRGFVNAGLFYDF